MGHDGCAGTTALGIRAGENPAIYGTVSIEALQRFAKPFAVNSARGFEFLSFRQGRKRARKREKLSAAWVTGAVTDDKTQRSGGYTGESPSGKARDFGSRMHRFESGFPCHI